MSFTWVPFYEELADKLLGYENRQDELFALLNKIGVDTPSKVELHEIDPFSFFALINKLGTEKRIQLFGKLKDELKMTSETPSDTDGIPMLTGITSLYFDRKDANRKLLVMKLWGLFKAVLNNGKIDSLFNECLVYPRDTYLAEKSQQ